MLQIGLWLGAVCWVFCHDNLEAWAELESKKIDGFLSFIPSWMLMYFFASFFFESHPLYMTKLRVLVLCFSYFTDNSIILKNLWFFFSPKGILLTDFGSWVFWNLEVKDIHTQFCFNQKHILCLIKSKTSFENLCFFFPLQTFTRSLGTLIIIVMSR